MSNRPINGPCQRPWTLLKSWNVSRKLHFCGTKKDTQKVKTQFYAEMWLWQNWASFTGPNEGTKWTFKRKPRTFLNDFRVATNTERGLRTSCVSGLEKKTASKTASASSLAFSLFASFCVRSQEKNAFNLLSSFFGCQYMLQKIYTNANTSSKSHSFEWKSLTSPIILTLCNHGHSVTLGLTWNLTLSSSCFF